MYRKGKISTIDQQKQMATVVFDEMDKVVSAKLPFLSIPIKDADFEFVVDQVTTTGKISIDYTPQYEINDWVAVAIFGANFLDGVIIGKIGG